MLLRHDRGNWPYAFNFYFNQQTPGEKKKVLDILADDILAELIAILNLVNCVTRCVNPLYLRNRVFRYFLIKTKNAQHFH